jgi:glycosyltransferase involved in cell wall biosynthesis/SAM-dependent methyltransferase
MPQASQNPIQDPAFLNPALSENNVDRYWVRKSVLEAVRRNLPLFHGVFLDIGCGVMPYRQLITSSPSSVVKYIGMDIVSPYYKANVDLRWDGQTMPLPDASIDSAMATEVLEHCPDPSIVLREARRVLKPGGVFFYTVPFVWPLHDAPYDFYRYTPFALDKMLKDSGFEDHELCALGGWNATLAQVMGLWMRRAPMGDAERAIRSKQLWPIYQQLVTSDQVPSDPRAGNTIATGWTGRTFKEGKSEAAEAPLEIKKVDHLCVANFSYSVYSETFIADHVKHLSDATLALWGNPPFVFNIVGKSPCVTPQDIQRLKAMPAPEQKRAACEIIGSRLKKEKIKVLLAEFGPMAVAMAPVCEMAGIPLVAHFHGNDASVYSWFANDCAYYKELFRVAKKIVVVSKVMEKRLLDAGAPRGKVVLNSYGVAVDGFTLANPAANKPLFIAVGRFVEKKRHDITIRAFSKVVAAVPDARLYIAGDGPMMAMCKKLVADLKLDGKVVFLGVISRRLVREYMLRSRAFVQHSVVARNGDSEGLPLSILESGAMALPVVSTIHAGIPEAVRSGLDGFLVGEGDIDGMADGMLTLAENPDYAASMGLSYRSNILQKYSRSISINGLSEIIRSAI